jgi:adenylate cyclase
VVNLSSRLCDQAKGGEILISEVVHAEFEDVVQVEPAGEFTLKGFPKPVSAFRVVGISPENT